MVISPTLDFSRAISSSRSSHSRSFRAVAAPASARSRHSVSLAIETFASRATSSSGSPRNSRATIAILRGTEKRLGPFPSTPEEAPAPALAEPPSGLRPSSFVMRNTPVEVQFINSAGCLNYPCRTPVGRFKQPRIARPGGEQDDLTDRNDAPIMLGSSAQNVANFVGETKILAIHHVWRGFHDRGHAI